MHYILPYPGADERSEPTANQLVSLLFEVAISYYTVPFTWCTVSSEYATIVKLTGPPWYVHMYVHAHIHTYPGPRMVYPAGFPATCRVRGI